MRRWTDPTGRVRVAADSNPPRSGSLRVVPCGGRALDPGHSTCGPGGPGPVPPTGAPTGRGAVGRADGDQRAGSARESSQARDELPEQSAEIVIPGPSPSFHPSDPYRCAQPWLRRTGWRPLPTPRTLRIARDHVAHSLLVSPSTGGWRVPATALGEGRGAGRAAGRRGPLLFRPVGGHDRGELPLDPLRVALIRRFGSWDRCCCRAHDDHLHRQTARSGVDRGGS